MSRIAIILPAYNEEVTVSATIESFHRELPSASIWVVNNRSTDATEQLARDTLRRLKCSGGVINETRPGKGNAIRRALLDIDSDVYVMADADLTYPASDVHAMLKPVLADEADMVVGDRHSQGQYANENKRALHGFGNRLVRGLVNWLFNAELTDIMSGYRVFNRRFVKTYPILAEGFEIETEMTLHALDKRLRIIEIPSDYCDRPTGSFSKLNTVKDGLQVLITIWNILRYYRPMLFFGACAMLFAIMGLLVAVPVIQDWIREQYIHHVPLAILATGLELIAVVLASIGLILDSICQQDRRHFELELLRMTPPNLEK